MYGLYELNPAPWGDDYRLIQYFEDKEAALVVLEVLERINWEFHTYKIIDWNSK